MAHRPHAHALRACTPPWLVSALFPFGLALQRHIFHNAVASRGVGALTLHRAAWASLYAGVCALGALLCRVRPPYDDPVATPEAATVATWA